MGSTYEAAGVSIAEGDRAVELIKQRIGKATRPEVLGGIGGFAGLFDGRFANLENPVLVSGTDGVGTKLQIAQTLDRHDTIGIDAVAMVVDDIVCEGAEPLFLLDYISCGRVVPERIADIVGGIARGCEIAGAALLGGETAEHPGVMDDDEYDIATFAVGVVDASERLGAHRVVEGDVIIGLPSSGLHANGYSLVRKLILDRDLDLNAPYSDEDARTLGETLLEPCAIYAPEVLEHARAGRLHAAAHITGGGLEANLMRVIPEGLSIDIDWSTWSRPPIFRYLREIGEVPEDELRRVFNCGIGMCLVAPADQAPDGLRIGTVTRT